MMNPLVRLGELGQSPWYDYITRDLVAEGELARLIAEDGLRGMTSNPTIFEKAVSGSQLYDDDLRRHENDVDGFERCVLESRQQLPPGVVLAHEHRELSNDHLRGQAGELFAGPHSRGGRFSQDYGGGSDQGPT